MLKGIVAISLRNRLLVLLAFAAVVGLGVRAWQVLPIDAFPDVTPTQVNIYTESPGLAAEDVEKLLSFPIETAMGGLPKVQQIRSLSVFGLSYVAVYFEDDMDIYFARRLVSERLAEAKGRIPQGYGEPELGPNSSGLGQVLWYTVESADKKHSLMDLRTLHDFSIRMMVRTAPGVDDVISWGGYEKQFQVMVDPEKLVKYGIGFRGVMDALSANNRQVGGQYLNIGREQYLIRGLGLVSNPGEIGGIVLAQRGGTPIYVRDVAEVKEGGGVRFGAVTRDGEEVVLGIGLARLHENAKGVVDAVKQRLKLAAQTLPAGVSLKPIYDRTDLVIKAVDTAETALVEGAILVAIVLFLFLGDLRSALVVVISLPVAMLIAFILMERIGLSANLMSLAGLAIGIGMMVDGAVVMVENSFRLLSQDSQAKSDRSELALRAASEVARPVAFAILIIIIVFLPLFSLTGIEGKLFKPMAITIALAMAGSLVLALTLVPVLASLLLRPRAQRDTWLMARIKGLYAPLLARSLAHKGKVAMAALLLLAVSIGSLPFLGKEFMPTLREGEIMFRVIGIPSTSLDESVRVSKRIATELHALPQTESVLATVGRAERGETEDMSYMEVLVKLKPSQHAETEELSRKMQAALEKAIPNAAFLPTQPIQMRVEELIAGVRATLALKIYGPDLPTLDRLASEMQRVLADVPGVTDLSAEANKGKPQLIVRVNRDEAARYGINADEIMEVVQAGIGGKQVGAVIDGTRRFDIQVRFAPEHRANVGAIQNTPLRTAGGALVPLSRIATITLEEGYSFVRREQLSRYAVLQMDVRGRDVDGFVKDAEARLRQAVKLPEGYRFDWGGAFENQQRALAKLSIIVPITIALIFVLLYMAFNSFLYAGLIIANVPFAIVGGVLALWISGQYLSVPSAIGFIAVFGVAMLNGIVLVEFINHLRAEGRSIGEAVREGTLLRLRPVLMTASIAIFGLLPMLLSTGVGAETQRPLATVVIGGLFTSTALTLLLLPLMYEWIETRRAAKKERPQR